MTINEMRGSARAMVKSLYYYQSASNNERLLSCHYWQTYHLPFTNDVVA